MLTQQAGGRRHSQHEGLTEETDARNWKTPKAQSEGQFDMKQRTMEFAGTVRHSVRDLHLSLPV